MEVLAALGLGARELFKYNRENFKFDQSQRIERESLRLEMQIKRFELFRDDVRDLVTLTVDRMDVYILVGALFLEFCVIFFCEGRVQGSAPPFMLSLFLLSNASAFTYLLVAVWLSMHASVASHSFGVRLLTRFIRLPIPTVEQVANLTSQLTDYESQGIGNMLRLPFLDPDKQNWKQVQSNKAEPKIPDASDRPTSTATLSAATFSQGDTAVFQSASQLTPQASTFSSPRAELSRQLSPPASKSTSPRADSYLAMASQSAANLTVPTESNSSFTKPVSSQVRSVTFQEPVAETNAAGPRPIDTTLLPQTPPLAIGGGDALLYDRAREGRPERHVQLFRQLQSKWQCYDAYCRVAMGIGVNQMLHAISYWAVCHTTVENASPTIGYALVTIFQGATLALAILDLSGLTWMEISAIQFVGMMSVLLTVISLVSVPRDEDGQLDSKHDYRLAPFCFLFQGVWLELWLRVSAPTGGEDCKLPRRFRQVLFLDVFGDAEGWSPYDEDTEPSSSEETRKTIEEAAIHLTLTQFAIRRWVSVPDWAPSPEERSKVQNLQNRLSSAGAQIQAELDQRSSTSGGLDGFDVFEKELRPWHELPASERLADPFAKCLLGPFEHDNGYGIDIYYFDLESQNCVYEDTPAWGSGAFVLTLAVATQIIEDLEDKERKLLSCRILKEMRRRSSIHAANLFRRRSAFHKVTNMFNTSFPNLKSLVVGSGSRGSASAIPNQPAAATPPSGPSNSFSGIEMRSLSNDARGATFSTLEANQRRRQNSRSLAEDPTLIAMAGEHAQHFAPERLPWKVLARLTRLIQAVWVWAGLWALLKEVGIYQIDFQATRGFTERRLCVSRTNFLFEDVHVEWPHGALFHPRGILCGHPASGELAVASPFALYATRQTESGKMELDEVDRSNMPVSSILLCAPFNHSVSDVQLRQRGACRFIAPSAEGLALWKVGDDHRGIDRVTLPWEGTRWQLVTGAVVRCDVLSGLSPRSGNATDCILLVGWDGRSLPVSLMPITAGAESTFLLGSASVRADLDVPLSPDEIAQGVEALSFDAKSGRLWVLMFGGSVQIWNLYTQLSWGTWSLRWKHISVDFKPAAICEDHTQSLYAIGRSKLDGPLLVKAPLPDQFKYLISA